MHADTLDLTSLTAVSAIDGRYGSITAPLRTIFSEFGFIMRRVQVEIAWLIALCDEPNLPEAPALSASQRAQLQAIADNFDLTAAARVKEIEAVTRHDVKAVEYYIRENLPADLASLSEFIHFACTSEDINNMAHSLMIRDARAVLLAKQEAFLVALTQFSTDHIALPMLARTHGQTASPTTLGKEMAIYVYRLTRQRDQLQALVLPGKMNGAVGNYNAHMSACPAVDWPAFSARVIASFGLAQNPYTTQIESHDIMAECFDIMQRWNAILMDFDRDIWSYVSRHYLTQKVVAGEVGSSTMPHKVNPIDFENSEGNVGLANALLSHLARKLTVSRMQRDLTDSTAIRSIGTAFGYTLIAIASATRGLSRISPNEMVLAQDLDHAWEVLAEPIQTVMRRYGVPEAYEKLKALTRGQAMDQAKIEAFIQTLDIPQADKDRLAQLTPASYIGLADKMAL